MKKLFACLLLICVICVTGVIPTFAYVDSEGNPSNEGFVDNPDHFTMATANHTVTNFRNIVNMIDQAYSLGLFGGAWPLAIRATNGGAWITVYCVPPQNNNGYAKRSDSAGWVELESGEWNFLTVADNVVSGQQCIAYTLMADGSFNWSGTASKVTGTQMIAYWDGDNEWVNTWNQSGGISTVNSGSPIPAISTISALYRAWLESPPSTEDAYNDGYNAGRENGFTAGRTEGELVGYENGYDDGVLQGYQTGYTAGDRDGYARGYSEGELAASPTILNVPSIFDSMFEGVQSIFKAVDIEIFGISILGTLIGFLVIAIVTFTVKRLMK